MEIKVGEYVRSHLGTIGKVTRIESNGPVQLLYEDGTLITTCKFVTKHSPNIIDIIEVGDYVNGYKVIDIVKGFKVIIDKLELDTTTGTYKNIGINDIKSILAHENFEDMEYKV